MRLQNFSRQPVQVSSYPHRKIVFTFLCLDGISCIVFCIVPTASFSFSGLTLPFNTTFHQIFTHIGKICRETSILQSEHSQLSTSPPTRDGHSPDSLQYAHVLLVLGSPAVLPVPSTEEGLPTHHLLGTLFWMLSRMLPVSCVVRIYYWLIVSLYPSEPSLQIFFSACCPPSCVGIWSCSSAC